MDKAKLRRELKTRRNAFTFEYTAEASRKLCEHILACAVYKEAKTILGYLAFGRELSLDYLLARALEDGKEVYVPHILSATEFVAARLKSMDDFDLDRYGIRCLKEPIEAIAPEKLDLVLVPAVAFAKDGNRLGMGAGYYDRFLVKCSQAFKIGIAYEELLQECLPKDQHDVAVPYIATESGIAQAIC